MPDRNIPTQRNSPKSLTCNGKEGCGLAVELKVPLQHYTEQGGGSALSPGAGFPRHGTGSCQ